MFDEEATLLVITNGKDEYGFPVESREEIPVYVKTVSATRDEFYKALQNGITIKTVFNMRTEDWLESERLNGSVKEYATQIEYDGAVYEVVRTYQKSKATIEVVCK